ncbi:MAG TPA: hypothetical protein VGJ28_08850 [Micromonosporaceae bacterium]|jgi:hypothetical protein
MRRLIVLAAATLLAVVGFAVPANAAAPSGGGWFRVPNPPFDVAAGVECAFPIHAVAIVDQVYGKTLQSYPDGSPEQQAFVGPLVVRVTNTDNNRSYDANASGSAIVHYGTDGSQTWDVVGPVLLNVKAGRSNLAQGIWIVNGIYQLVFPATGPNSVHLVRGTELNVCNKIS